MNSPSEYQLPPLGIDLFAEVACIWEVSARKVGNVFLGRNFRDAGAVDFLLSATAIRSVFQFPGNTSTGGLIRRATEETRAIVGTNTNLGIILLLAPLVNAVQPLHAFRTAVRAELHNLTVQDAQQVYHAIRIANPGGLGDAPEQDVRNEPTITLLEAMKLATDRDMIARQYANDFADVFDFGVPAFVASLTRFGCVEAAIIDSQFGWLAKYPDSLIARKNGLTIAEDVQRLAEEVQQLGGIATPEGRAAGVTLDKYLRSDGNKLNPGTTADLITACLFVALRENKVKPSAPFLWDVNDWL